MYRVKYDRAFWTDLYEVLKSIAEASSSVKSVEKWSRKIIEATESLNYMPYRSSKLPYGKSLYSIKVGKYKVFYSIFEAIKEIHVHRLVLGRRNLVGIFAS